MSKEAMKLALEALEYIEHNYMSLPAPAEKAITALRQALANEALDKKAENARELGLDYEPAQQEPVAWLITDEKINSLQVDSIQRLIDRARHAHMTDIKLCINGQDEWYQADWLKHLIHATPAQRKPLTDEEIDKLPWGPHEGNPMTFAEGLRDFARAIEAAHSIKENT